MDAHSDMHAPTSSLGLSRVPLTSMSQGAEGKLELSSDTIPAASTRAELTKDWLPTLIGLIVFMCVSLCAIANFLTETVPGSVFQVQIAALGAAGLLTVLQAALLSYVRSEQSLWQLRLGLILASALLYGAADERFIVYITDAHYTGSSVSAFLPAACILVASSRLIRYRPLPYFLTSSLVGLGVAGFLICGLKVASTIAELAVFTTVQVWYSWHLKKHGRQRRSAVPETLEWTGAEEIEGWDSHDEALSTERELLLHELQVVYELLSELLPAIVLRDAREKFKEALKRLKITGHTLQTTENIDKVRLGFVASQVDAEYRSFLEQNCFPPAVRTHAQSRNRKSIEVIALPQEVKSLVGLLVKSWNFDMMQLSEHTGRPLELVGMFVLKKYGLMPVLQLDEAKCEQTLRAFEQRYLPNPYHNGMHAADVAHSLLYFYDQSVVLQVANEVELFASIIAALAHDVGHPGFNNRYLINTKSSFARICKAYVDNDMSVLEMMHTALAFEILENTHLLEPLTWENWVLFRKVVVDLILATDMMRHFELVNAFKARFSGKLPAWEEFDDRASVYRLCIKCADVGHAAKSTALHEAWTWKVVEEFFHQGDLEREQHMPISAFCDRYNADVASSQAGFIQNMVLPMFEAVNVVLRSEAVTASCLNQLAENVKFWEHKRKTARSHTQQPAEEATPSRLPPFSERKTVMN